MTRCAARNPIETVTEMDDVLPSATETVAVYSRATSCGGKPMAFGHQGAAAMFSNSISWLLSPGGSVTLVWTLQSWSEEAAGHQLPFSLSTAEVDVL